MRAALPDAGQVAPRSSLTDVASDVPSLGRVLETMSFSGGYNTNLVIAGTTLLGLAAGVIGVFALLRKRSLVTDALSHATLPGIGFAFLVAGWLGIQGRSLPVLLVGAACSAVLGVVCIQAILRHTRLHEDAAIGIVLSVFFGAGIVGLSYIQSNAAAGSAGLNQFLYGQAATMQPVEVFVMAGIAAAAILATLLFLKEFALVSFDDEFAAVDGWPVSTIDLVMMGLVVVVTVAGLQAVGVVLVVAMLIIPPVTARFWTERLERLVLLAALFGAASGYLGSVVSALLPRKPAGAVIVLCAGVLFALSMVFAPARGVIAASLRRLRLRLRIAADHLLEAGYEAGTKPLRSETVASLAALRGWSRPFESLLVWRLGRRGLLRRDPRGGLVLTDPGFARGRRVSRNHVLWEQYLVSHADVAPSRVDWSVDQVEHVLSDEMIEELETALRSRGIVVPAGGAS